MSLRLIIFDLDGTLVDTAEDIRVALNRAIEPLGLRPLGLEETAALVGEGTERLMEKALAPLPDRVDEETKKAALGRFLESYSENLAVHSKAYPGVRETLEKLGPFEKAVLSNKREELSRRLLEKLGLDGFFTFVAGSDTTASRKPSPAPVLFILKMTGMRPEEAILVGDSPYDIAAARGAGVSSVAVTYGYRDRSLLNGASYAIDDFGSLAPLVLELESMRAMRREPRHFMPPVCRDYVQIGLMEKDIPIPTTLLDFSERGIMVETPVPLEPGFPVSCELSVPLSFSHTVSITGEVKHSKQWEDRCMAGIEIKGVSSEIWFRVFVKIMQYIKERVGTVF